MKRPRWRFRIGVRNDSRGGYARALARQKDTQRYDSIMQQSGQRVPCDPTQSVGIEVENFSFLVFNVELTRRPSAVLSENISRLVSYNAF